MRLIERRGLPPVTLSISLDAETRTISGTAASLDGTAPFTSALALAKRTAAGPRAGTYAVEIVGDGTLGAPEKRGIANVRLGAGGNVILVGKAGDGTAFSTSAFLHADQTFPLYAVLYDGNATTRGSLRGKVRLPGSQTTDSLEWFQARPAARHALPRRLCRERRDGIRRGPPVVTATTEKTTARPRCDKSRRSRRGL